MINELIFVLFIKQRQINKSLNTNKSIRSFDLYIILLKFFYFEKINLIY